LIVLMHNKKISCCCDSRSLTVYWQTIKGFGFGYKLTNDW